MKKLRILALDGGGIRGIIPATILVEIENRLRFHPQGNPEARLANYFDLIAGTSTGGILSALYLCPNDEMKPRFSAAEALGLYLDNGHKIFEKEFLQRVMKLHVVFDEMYPKAPLESLLESYFGSLMLSDLLKPCLITAYDIRNRRGHFFSSVDAKRKSIYDFKLKDVCRATSAAPTYFEPAKFTSEQGADYTLIDGGVFVNNPALAAYSEARSVDFSLVLGPHKPCEPSAKDMLLISIGTGSVKKPYKWHDIKDAGLISWLPIIIDVMMSGNSETVHYHLTKMYDTLKNSDKDDYIRLEPNLADATSDMDDVRPENLLNLHNAGLQFVAKNDAILDEIVEKLIANA
ncbi:MAG: patatin [Bacteroidetes bacterium]|nr:MAG: patatin [Bacteroidota bacterium]